MKIKTQKKTAITFDKGAICFDGRPVFVFSGEMLYHRLPPDQWQDRLEKARAAGLNGIGFYLPWNYHASTPETVDFKSPDRDAGRFMDLAHELGLLVLARPGPFICNEWDLGGFPGWLMTKDSGEWRTGDPRHLKWSRRWYRQVNRIIAPRQYGRKGSVFLYQVENEHYWGDKNLFDGLRDQAVGDGIEVPIIGNGGGSSRRVGSTVADATDMYTGINEPFRWRGWVQHVIDLNGPDIPLMFIEYAGARLVTWGEPSGLEFPLPNTWPTMQDRMYIGMGAGMLNHFPIAGGITPPGFGSDHVTTNYFEDAAITPWGGLTRKFYLVRLLGEFVASFNRPLAAARPWKIGWGTDNGNVECLARKGADGIFLFCVNHSNDPHVFSIVLPDGRKLGEGALQIGPLDSMQFVADYRLGRGVRLNFCTAQIMRFWMEGRKVHLVVYGAAGSKGFAEFESMGCKRRILFVCDSKVHRQEMSLGKLRIELFAVSQELAETTWFADGPEGTIPLFSNLSLVRPKTEKSEPLRAELPAGIPLHLITTNAARTLKVDGENQELRRRRDGLYEMSVSMPCPPEHRIAMDEPVGKNESDVWTTDPIRSSDGWSEVKLFQSDYPILIDLGVYRYRKAFEVSGAMPKTMEFLGISQAEMVVWLNGEQLGVFPKSRKGSFFRLPKFSKAFDVEGKVRPGRNELAVEFTLRGRSNGGQPIRAGLSQPVALYDERNGLALNCWKQAPYDHRRWTAREMSALPTPARPGHNLDEWKDMDLSKPGMPCAWDAASSMYQVNWYRTKAVLPASFKDRHVFLECPRCHDLWVYVDGKMARRTSVGASATIDLSAFAGRKEFEITLGLRNLCAGYDNLASPPKLVAFDHILDGKWNLRACPQRTAGQPGTEGWAPPDHLPPARVVWYRRNIRIERTEGLAAPLYVELDDQWKTHATIFWNGKPIGMYAVLGPDRKFYVPDGMIRETNELLILADGYDRQAACGGVRLGHYYRARYVSLYYQGG